MVKLWKNSRCINAPPAKSGNKTGHGGFHKWAYPQMDGLFHGKSNLEMDDDWGYP